jgi:predicted nicotinamide N-methyase
MNTSPHPTAAVDRKRRFPPAPYARQRLLHRIGQTYAVRPEPVRLGNVSLDFFRIDDPDRVLDMVAEEADRREKIDGDRAAELHLPYWAELWDSALGVATYLATQDDWASRLPALRVLDLGCGMGLTGATAAALGASVMLADLEPPALLFAQLNTIAYAPCVRTRQLDWRRDRLGEQFDLIIGADILYEKQQWQYLAPFWQHHLAPGGTVLLGEPGRMTGEMFLPWIMQRGWEVRESQQVVETRIRPIRILTLTSAR